MGARHPYLASVLDGIWQGLDFSFLAAFLSISGRWHGWLYLLTSRDWWWRNGERKRMHIRGPWEMLKCEFKASHSYCFSVRISEEILEFIEKKKFRAFWLMLNQNRRVLFIIVLAHTVRTEHTPSEKSGLFEVSEVSLEASRTINRLENLGLS